MKFLLTYGARSVLRTRVRLSEQEYQSWPVILRGEDLYCQKFRVPLFDKPNATQHKPIETRHFDLLVWFLFFWIYQSERFRGIKTNPVGVGSVSLRFLRLRFAAPRRSADVPEMLYYEPSAQARLGSFHLFGFRLPRLPRPKLHEVVDVARRSLDPQVSASRCAIFGRSARVPASRRSTRPVCPCAIAAAWAAVYQGSRSLNRPYRICSRIEQELNKHRIFIEYSMNAWPSEPYSSG